MSDGEIPEEIILANAIKRYGVNGVLGRPMSALEIKRIGLAENMVNICYARGEALNAGEWEKENPDAGALFRAAGRLAADMGLIKVLE